MGFGIGREGDRADSAVMALERLEADTPVVFYSRLGRNPFWLLVFEQFPREATSGTEHKC
jgi:hypothetical protein